MLISRPEITRAGENILKTVNRKLRPTLAKVPVRVGRLSKKGYLGVFKHPTNVIRLLQADDFPTFMHEIGHQLEFSMFGWKKGSAWTGRTEGVTWRMQKELTFLGKKLYGSIRPRAGYKREGWAEFVRLWLTDETPSDYPQILKFFESNVLSDPDLKQAFQDTKDKIRVWEEMSPTERVGMTITQIGPKSKRTKESLRKLMTKLDPRKWTSRARQKFVESGAPLEAVMNAVEKQVGKLRPSQDIYAIYDAFRSTADKIAHRWVNHGVTNIKGDYTAKPLTDAFALVRQADKSKLPKGDPVWAFAIYLVAKRTVALWYDDKGSRETGVEIQDAKEAIAQLQSKEFDLAAEIVWEWSEAVLEYAKSSSPNFARAVIAIRQRDPGWYIPLFRDFLGEEPAGPGGGAASSSLSKRLKGSWRPVKNPFLSLIENAQRIIQLSHKELVLSQLVDLANDKNLSIGELIEPIPRDRILEYSTTLAKLTDRTMDELAKRDIEWTLDEDETNALSANDVVNFFSSALYSTDKHVLAYPDPDGKMEWYFVNDLDLLKSLSLMEEPAKFRRLVNMIRTTANIKRAGTTGLVPYYNFVANVVRDLPTMLILRSSKASVPQMLFYYLKNMGQAAMGAASGDKWMQDMYDLADAVGIRKTGGRMSMDIKYTSQSARNISRSTMQKFMDPRNWYDYLRDLMQFTELAPRLAAMEAKAEDVGYNREQGKTLSLNDALDRMIPIMREFKHVTGDWGRGGEWTQKFGRLVPFQTSSIQGQAVFYRNLKNNPKLIIPRVLSYITMPSLMYWWWIKDEEWWEELTLMDKMTKWFFPVDEDVLIGVPKPHEIGFLFSSLPVTLIDTWYRVDPEKTKEFFQQFMLNTDPEKTPDFSAWDMVGAASNIMMPPVMPVPLEMGVEQALNWHLYFERPIEPQWMRLKPKGERYGPYTARAAIVLGEATNLSPYRLEHAIRSLTGSLGGQILQGSFGIGESGRTGKKELADDWLYGRIFRRGGTVPYRSQSEVEVYNRYEKMSLRMNSKTQLPTEREKEEWRRLENATVALELLARARSVTGADKRRLLSKERVKIAQDALLPLSESGYLQDERREAKSVWFESKASSLTDDERRLESGRLEARIAVAKARGKRSEADMLRRRLMTISGGLVKLKLHLLRQGKLKSYQSYVRQRTRDYAIDLIGSGKK